MDFLYAYLIGIPIIYVIAAGWAFYTNCGTSAVDVAVHAIMMALIWPIMIAVLLGLEFTKIIEFLVSICSKKPLAERKFHCRPRSTAEPELKYGPPVRPEERSNWL